MANIFSYPFESQNIGTDDAPVYDRAISAEMLRKINMLLYSNGVLRNNTTKDYQTSLQVLANDDYTVTVKQGAAMLQGATMVLEEDAVLELAVADTSNPRIDRIVVRINNSVSARNIELAVLTGIPATSPQPPAITAQANYFEMVLADIRVNANAAAITGDDITDKRADESVCGWCKPILPPTMNTAALYLQNVEGVVPGAEDVIVLPAAGYNGLSAVAIPGDADLIPDNVRSGVEIFGIEGSFTGSNEDYINYVQRIGTSVVLPPETTKLPAYACYEWTELQTCVMPDGIVDIGTMAFRNCPFLNFAAFPSALKTIGASAFDGCSALAATQMPEGVTSIGNYAFQECGSLALAALPSTITAIGTDAFASCAALRITQLPPGLTYIRARTFQNCININIGEIPDGVLDIALNAFDGCTSIEKLTIPASVTALNGYCFKGCTGLTEINFLGTPTKIQSTAFNLCTQAGLVINVPWAEGAVSGAPWGATNATINYGVTVEE